MDSADNLVSIFARRVADDGPRPAIWVKRATSFSSLTWNEVASDAQRAAHALYLHGVRPGDRVVQVSENRYEWVIADLAIQMNQAVHVPVHAPLTGIQIRYQILHSGARHVLFSTIEQATKVASCAEQLPGGLQYWSYDPSTVTIGSNPVGSFATMLAGGSATEGAELQLRAEHAWRPDSLATILYTSGTTGEPKGVMLSQSNLASNTQATMEAFGHREGELRLNFLPLSHIFARTCDLYVWLVDGSELALAQSRESVLDDCALIHPTRINGVPYFFERVIRRLRELGLSEEPGSLRTILGGRIEACCSGGAALPDATYDYFVGQDVPLLQGYGLTESSPVITLSTPTHERRGCVGRPIRDTEVRVAADGEILARGPQIMSGYYLDPTATEQALEDGWLHTGDLGELDADGYLRITGRKKELIVTSGGKNIAPVLLESLLTQDPLILQALVIGDGRSYLTALIVPNPDALRKEIIARQLFRGLDEKPLRDPRVRELYEERIRERLSSVSTYEQVRKFTLLDRGFTIESGELTPKLTLRRKVIEANCAAAIEDMYGASGAAPPETR